MKDKLECREFMIDFSPYRVFSANGEPLLVQVLTNHIIRNSLVWRELEGKVRNVVIKYWRDVASRQLDLFL